LRSTPCSHCTVRCSRQSRDTAAMAARTFVMEGLGAVYLQRRFSVDERLVAEEAVGCMGQGSGGSCGFVRGLVL
jgi:hypothetical protein